MAYKAVDARRLQEGEYVGFEEKAFGLQLPEMVKFLELKGNDIIFETLQGGIESVNKKHVRVLRLPDDIIEYQLAKAVEEQKTKAEQKKVTKIKEAVYPTLILQKTAPAQTGDTPSGGVETVFPFDEEDIASIARAMKASREHDYIYVPRYTDGDITLILILSMVDKDHKACPLTDEVATELTNQLEKCKVGLHISLVHRTEEEIKSYIAKDKAREAVEKKYPVVVVRSAIIDELFVNETPEYRRSHAKPLHFTEVKKLKEVFSPPQSSDPHGIFVDPQSPRVRHIVADCAIDTCSTDSVIIGYTEHANSDAPTELIALNEQQAQELVEIVEHLGLNFVATIKYLPGPTIQDLYQKETHPFPQEKNQYTSDLDDKTRDRFTIIIDGAYVLDKQGNSTFTPFGGEEAHILLTSIKSAFDYLRVEIHLGPNKTDYQVLIEYYYVGSSQEWKFLNEEMVDHLLPELHEFTSKKLGLEFSMYLRKQTEAGYFFHDVNWPSSKKENEGFKPQIDVALDPSIEQTIKTISHLPYRQMYIETGYIIPTEGQNVRITLKHVGVMLAKLFNRFNSEKELVYADKVQLVDKMNVLVRIAQLTLVNQLDERAHLSEGLVRIHSSLGLGSEI